MSTLLSCGPACLQAVLESHGIEKTIEQVIADMGIPEGATESTAAQIVAGAEANGLFAQGFARDKVLLGEEQNAIAHWGGNHFVVINSIEGNTVRVYDPNLRRRTIHRLELDHYYSGTIIEIHPAGE